MQAGGFRLRFGPPAETSDDDRLSISGPDVQLQPKPGQVLALAIHELAVNAVEHGAVGATGWVHVSISVDGQGPSQELRVVWKESDGPTAAEPSNEGFGTEVLTQMLSYELNANSTITYEADGLSCTIALPLSECVGRVAEE